MNKRYLPNILSILRIPLSISLFFFFQQTSVFVCFYLLLGLTDFFDGYLARKWKVESELGARLDSIGDFFFFIALLAYLFVVQRMFINAYLVLILAAFSLRIINILLGVIKHRKLIMLHTIANKLAGIATYIAPILLIFNLSFAIPILFVIILFAPLEEFLILLRSPKGAIDLNMRGFLFLSSQ